RRIGSPAGGGCGDWRGARASAVRPEGRPRWRPYGRSRRCGAGLAAAVAAPEEPAAASAAGG
ncbi:hypothetical protein, partial [Streptomyces fradiae]|uniref:hypothetical protein n=1 Tax=Streptomyces fradiae TaxID=1906 RepID=UPI001C403199